ncbi:MAG: thrombospondin type 3 repeat:Cna B-type [Halioglobus sp.]|nr:thrombospondin type 3 repeat:Cna B-type [Halioglobus sp.]
MKRQHRTPPPLLAAALFALATSAQALVIDFEGHSAGTIIDDEYTGLSFNGVNVARGNASNLATIFDTTSPTGGDTDLAGPFANANLGALNPGNVLILHEHPHECDGTTCSDPDDEGRRPAGYFDIDFGTAVTLNSIDFFDIEGAENGATPNNAISLFDAFDVEISAGTFYTPHTGGDNTWDRLQLGVAGVKSMRIRLGGSGAIDNIDYIVPRDQPPEVPVPATPLLLLLGLGLLAGRGRAARR